MWIRADKFLVRFLNRLYTSFTANSSHTGCCNLPDLTYRYLFHGLALLCNFQLFVYYQNCLSRLDRGGVGRLLLLLFFVVVFCPTSLFDPRSSHFYTVYCGSSDHCRVSNSARKQTFDANVHLQGVLSNYDFRVRNVEACCP